MIDLTEQKLTYIIRNKKNPSKYFRSKMEKRIIQLLFEVKTSESNSLDTSLYVLGFTDDYKKSIDPFEFRSYLYRRQISLRQVYDLNKGDLITFVAYSCIYLGDNKVFQKASIDSPYEIVELDDVMNKWCDYGRENISIYRNFIINN